MNEDDSVYEEITDLSQIEQVEASVIRPAAVVNNDNEATNFKKYFSNNMYDFLGDSKEGEAQARSMLQLDNQEDLYSIFQDDEDESDVPKSQSEYIGDLNNSNNNNNYNSSSNKGNEKEETSGREWERELRGRRSVRKWRKAAQELPLLPLFLSHSTLLPSMSRNLQLNNLDELLEQVESMHSKLAEAKSEIESKTIDLVDADETDEAKQMLELEKEGAKTFEPILEKLEAIQKEITMLKEQANEKNYNIISVDNLSDTNQDDAQISASDDWIFVEKASKLEILLDNLKVSYQHSAHRLASIYAPVKPVVAGLRYLYQIYTYSGPTLAAILWIIRKLILF